MSTHLQYDEVKLFTQIAAGDETAFAMIFRLYYPPLYNSALRYVKNEFWAEEVVQEVFTAVWTGREKLGSVEHPAGWMHRLVWNKAIDRIRRQEAELKAQYALRFLAEDNMEGELAATRETMFVLLEKAVSQLSPQRKSVYELRYHQKLSLEEIAQQLNLTRNTVRNHLALALENIRAYLLRHSHLVALCWLCHLLV